MKKITPKQYAGALYASFKDQPSDKIEKIFDNFLAFVWANKDWKNLSKILTSFEKIYQDKEGLADAQIISSTDLSSKLKNHLQSWLDQFTGKKVEVKYNIDQALLGGVVIKYDDLILDASLKTQLANLHKQLTN
ncbi:MAG: ATP synthase F1 subunit delta [Candidatus Komeilibacteria bacterium]|nr:ATP synthase F1 subunit delta [Candidatus Komeilibacteria bacterium]